VKLISLFLLLSGAARAQECGSVPDALTDLNDVVGAFYTGAEGVAAYCPDDLSTALDLNAADQIAAGMNTEGRAQASEQIANAAKALGTGQDQALANAAALLDALYGAELEDGGGAEDMLTQIHGLADMSSNANLHRQIGLNLWRRGAKDDQSTTLIQQILPEKPDYSRIFKDGRNEVQMVLRTGYDGFKHSYFEKVFRGVGAEVETIVPGEEMMVRYTVQPDDPSLEPVTWFIDIIDSDSDSHLKDVKDADLPVSMYGYHSNLGTALDESLALRPDGGELSTDFFWVDACKSKVFASQLSKAYPMAHFVYTRDAEYFVDMPVSLERGLVALANQYDYDQMERLVGAGGAWKSKNYIFPNNSEKFAYQDQDGDGIADAEDRLFNFDQGAQDLYPNGEKASRAVHIANTYMGYSAVFTGVEDAYRPDGIFDGEPGGALTRIETRKDAYGNTKHFVAVSDEMLKMDQSQYTASIAAEMTQHWGQQQGWSAETTQAVAFLTGTAVYGVWHGAGYADYQATYYPQKTYRSYEAAHYLSDEDFVTSKGVASFIRDNRR
jgi:hypothetical protein